MDKRYTEEDPIIHYGVLGMRWGVRKSRGGTPPGTRTKGSGKKTNASKASEDSKKKKSLSKKRASSLSNKQIREHNERARLEQEFKQLTSTEKSRANRIINEILVDVGKNQAKYALNQISRKYVDRGLASLSIPTNTKKK